MRSEMLRILPAPKPPLGDQGEVARSAGGDEKLYVLPHRRWRSATDNVLIPSVACGDSFPWSPREALDLRKPTALALHPCLSLWGRCPSEVTDGEGQQRPYRPSQSASLTALPKMRINS